MSYRYISVTQERIDYALAFVGGVMMAVASLELMPEALRYSTPSKKKWLAPNIPCVMVLQCESAAISVWWET